MSNINQLVYESIQSNYRSRVEVLILKDNKVLLTHIPPYPPLVNKFYFGFPGGGIEPNDSPIETCIKESKEELGILINNVKKINMKQFIFNFPNQLFIKNKDPNAYSNTLEKRFNTFKGTITTYYSASYVKEDKSIYGADGEKLKYNFYDIPKAIDIFDNLIKTFEDKSKIDIFKNRKIALENL